MKKLLAILSLTLICQTAQALPEIQHWKNSNGVRVLFIHAPELPMLDIRLVFDAGSAREGQQWGVAQLTNSLLDHGTQQLNEDELAEQIEGLGAELAVSSLRDMSMITLRSLTQSPLLTAATDIMAQVIQQPSFPAKVFAREQQRLLAAIKKQQQSPSTVNSQAFFKNLYGQHPYAHPSSGTMESVQALKRKDILAHYQRFYVGNNAVLAMVGNINRLQAEALSRKLTAQLPAGTIAPALDKPKPLTAAKHVTQNFPSSQTHILLGQLGVSRHDPDYYALYVGNHLFGGSGLVSRLSSVLREEHGMAYSVYSYFSPMREAGPFIMGMQTRQDQADKAVELLREELQKWVLQGPAESEVDDSKANIIGGFALKIDSNAKMTEYLAMIGFYHLPLSYLADFNQHIAAVSRQQIIHALKRRIDPQKLIEVRTGKKP